MVTPPPPPRPKVAAAAPSTSPAARAARALAAQPRAGDGFAFAAEGVDRKSLRALEDGDRPAEASLDLHGRKVASAEASLDAFVRGSLASGRRVVHVIHGRGLGSGEGGPVLRKVVLERLTAGALSAHVLAVVAAPPRLGGSGACLVWLRKA